MPVADTIQDLQNPSVPTYDPLAQASVPQAAAQIITTGQANGSNGSVDNGGPIDRCAWMMTEKQAAGSMGRMVRSMSAANTWSSEYFGLPLAIPTVEGVMARGTVTLLGAFVGGFHGYKRSGGKGLPTAGYAIAGAMFPLITLGVGLFQGYGKHR